MFDWRQTTIGNVMTLQRGVDITRAEQREGSVPVVSSGGVASYHDTAVSQGPGVVMGRKGSLGKVFYFEGPYWPHDTTLWVRDFKGNDARFVYYFLTQLDTRFLDVGSANPTLNRNHVHPLPVRWPSVHVQRGIAEVLGALDDKIAANANLITAADELSSLKFEALLPGGDSVPLSSMARFVNGRAFTKGASGTGRVVIRIAELNSGLSGSTVYNDIEVPDDHLARAGDLLFAWSGSLTVHRWYRDEGIVNQHIFKVVPAVAPMMWVVKGALDRKLAEFKAIAADKATTMGHIQRRHLDEPVKIPSVADINAEGDAMAALWSRALSAEQETLQLDQIRDALLPLLMSGKIRVKDAERVVQGVV